jgi:mannose/fructose/N-acetylgalactosamine-specific phosphotransferase system component IIC
MSSRAWKVNPTVPLMMLLVFGLAVGLILGLITGSLVVGAVSGVVAFAWATVTVVRAGKRFLEEHPEWDV